MIKWLFTCQHEEEIQTKPGQIRRGVWTLTAHTCLWPDQASRQILTQQGVALQTAAADAETSSCRDWAAQKDSSPCSHAQPGVTGSSRKRLQHLVPANATMTTATPRTGRRGDRSHHQPLSSPNITPTTTFFLDLGVLPQIYLCFGKLLCLQRRQSKRYLPLRPNPQMTFSWELSNYPLALQMTDLTALTSSHVPCCPKGLPPSCRHANAAVHEDTTIMINFKTLTV